MSASESVRVVSLAALSGADRAISEETLRFNERLEAMLAELPATHEVPAEVTRQARLEGQGIFPQHGPDEGSDWRDIPGAPGGPGRVRLSLPDGAPAGLFLHIHGGGWTLGAADQYDLINQRRATETGAVVASIAYRLAPENPWPACLEDCVAAALWAIASAGPEFGVSQIAIGGESAGAHLAAATLLALEKRGAGGAFAGAALNYGCYDLRMTPSMAGWGARKLILSTPTVAWFLDNLDPDGAARVTAAASPLFADLRAMPPALFQVGTWDPLIDDTLFMAARWAEAGREAELRVYPGGVHAFDMFELEISREAAAAEAAFLRRAFEG